MKTQPLYEVVKNYLITTIRDNRGNEGFLLPSENFLCMKFNVSRITVRKAFADLEKDGVIVRSQGRRAAVNAESAPAAQQSGNNLIALILPDITTELLQQITLGVRHCCDQTQNDYILLPTFSSPQSEQHSIGLAKKLGCGGVLLMPVDNASYSDALLGLVLEKVPCIFLDRQLIGLNIPVVYSDHRRMGYAATRRLLDEGATHIAYFAQTDEITSVNERENGYVAALEEQHNPNRCIVKLAGIRNELLNEKMLYFLQKNPAIDGIVINSGIPAAHAIRAMRRLGKEIGRDYRMIVFDGNNTTADLCLDEPVPAIVQDGYRIGYTACELLLRQIAGGKAPPPKTIIPLPAADEETIPS